MSAKTLAESQMLFFDNFSYPFVVRISPEGAIDRKTSVFSGK